jgi:GT2 family glycosyltransferase
VVVVTYNSASLLPDLIASLEEGMAGTAWELIVVDNNSSDDVESCLRRLAPPARFLQTGRNAGYAAGINAGVSCARAHDAILVLNPDVRLLPGCALALFESLATHGAGIAVPHIVDGEGELILTIRREPTLLRAWAEALLGAERAGRHARLGEVASSVDVYDSAHRVDWAEGSTMLVSARCWDECGPWDESFFLYSEETDFALRARDRGQGAVYVPGAHAVHLEGDSSVSPPLWALLVLNKVRLYRRRHHALGAVAFWTAQVVREGSRSVLGRATSQRALAALLSPRRLRETPGPHLLGERSPT